MGPKRLEPSPVPLLGQGTLLGPPAEGHGDPKVLEPADKGGYGEKGLFFFGFKHGPRGDPL